MKQILLLTLLIFCGCNNPQKPIKTITPQDSVAIPNSPVVSVRLDSCIVYFHGNQAAVLPDSSIRKIYSWWSALSVEDQNKISDGRVTVFLKSTVCDLSGEKKPSQLAKEIAKLVSDYIKNFANAADSSTVRLIKIQVSVLTEIPNNNKTTPCPSLCKLTISVQ